MADKENNNTEELDTDLITSALQLWKRIYDEKEVIVKFIKKDKTERSMRCTLDFKQIHTKDHPKRVDKKQILKLIKKNKIVHVFDLDKKAWRSIPFDRTEYLDTATRRYYIKKKK